VKTLLVTGGAGFIGSNFIRYWLREYPQDRVINLDVLTYAGNLESLADLDNSPNYQFVRGDICDAALLETLFNEQQIDTVVHFAAESHVDRSIHSPDAFIQTNVFGTFALLEAAKKSWAGNFAGKRFLHVSTDEVYGSLGPDDAPFSETTAYAPNSPYSASKASSDHLVRAYFHTYGLPVLTTNCSNNYGPCQFPEKLIPLVISNAMEGKAIPVYGDGRNIRDWLYVDDHCSGIDAVLQRGRLGETYNIGGCNEWHNIDIVTTICDYLDSVEPAAQPRRNLISYVKDRPGHDQRYAIDAGKMAQELGWTPAHSFEQAIVDTIEWYRSNQAWVNHVKSGSYQSYYQSHYGAAD
jgi:dTDP-glucose 4,6-dehydratase